MREVDRIRKVYQEYYEDESWIQRWSVFNPMEHFMEVQREKQVLRLLKEQHLANMKVLDLGCGTGNIMNNLLTYGVARNNLFGLDLLMECLQTTKRLNPFYQLVQADATVLPFEDHCFDLIIQFTMFSSVLDETVRQSIANEMLRILKTDGFILWYDLKSNKQRTHIRGIDARRLKKLFSKCHCKLRSVTLRFGIASRVVSFSWILAELIEKFPMFRTHYLAIIRKR